MDGYKITVTDESYRRLDDTMIQWELDGGRAVRVSAFYGKDLYPHPAPRAEVKIFEESDTAARHAVIVMPPNGPDGGMRAEVIPLFMDVLHRAAQIAADADERIRREDEAARRAEAEAGAF